MTQGHQSQGEWGGVVQGTLRAYKAAYIVVDNLGRPGFTGAGMGGTYGPVDLARCVRHPDHVPPVLSCGCGFYAWHRRDDAVDLLMEHLPALLDVEVWGAFHEFEDGLIAAAQLVTSVTLARWCIGCLNRGPDACMSAVGLFPLPTAPDNCLVPLCDDHAGSSADQAWTPTSLSEAWGLPVGWATDDDPIMDIGRLLASTLTLQPPRQLPGLDDLLPGETAHVFQESIAADVDGSLWVDPRARLIQPLPGIDVPIRLSDNYVHEILLDGLSLEPWRPRRDRERFALPVQVARRPTPRPRSAPS